MPRPSIRFLSFMNAFLDDTDHQDEPFFLFNWNCVDVPDAQGTLRYGMVIDATESGLLVDFADGQSPRIVEYGRSFRVPDMVTEKFIQNADNIQILVRINNHLPLTWFAGKLLDPNTSVCPYRLVEVEFEMDGVVNRELVHTTQIRDAPNNAHERFISMDPLIAKEGDFTTGLCPLPDSYASSLSESSPLWKIRSQKMYEEGSVLSMGIHNGNMEYLWCPMSWEKIDSRFNMEKCLDEEGEHLEDCLKKGLAWTGRFHTMAPVTVQPDDQSAIVQLPSLQSLPFILLVEIFQFLDSGDRVGQRRVCTHWDDILRVQSIFSDVCVTLKYPYDRQFKWSVWDGKHAVVMVMKRLITKYTKWVIIVESPDCRSGGSVIVQHAEVLLRLLVEVARHFPLPSARKLNLIISGYKWRSYLESLRMGLEGLASLCTQLASTYDKLLWKNCVFEKAYLETYHVFWEAVIFVREGSIKAVSPNVQADLWEMLDRSVPQPDPLEISKWLARLTREGDIANVQEILEEFHMSDPRLPAQSTLYQSEEVASVDCRTLQLGRLTRLTRWMLAQRKAEDADWEDESEDG